MITVNGYSPNQTEMFLPKQDLSEILVKEKVF